MLTLLNALQLVFYIALLALLGQALLYLLAGPKRETNVFYQLLRVISKPFTWLVRRLTPVRVADRHVPFIAFGLLALAYLVVTIEKINLCVDVNMAGCL
jgi:hypothetical protein